MLAAGAWADVADVAEALPLLACGAAVVAAGGVCCSTRPEAVSAVSAEPEREALSCPSAMPAENAACSNVAWCSYPLEGARGLAAKCGCSLGHWLCLRVRDEHRANKVPVEDLPLTTASCTEGSACEEGTTCTVSHQRSCGCTSSGRLRCVSWTQ